MKTFYDIFNYPATDLYVGADNKLRPEYRLRHDFDPSVRRILVIGCGTVELACRAYGNPGIKFVGLDVAKDVLEVSKKIVKAHDMDNCSFVHSDFMDYDPNEKFDFIFATGVIHHNPDASSFVKKIHSHLNWEGILWGMVYSQKERGHVWRTAKNFKDYPYTPEGIEKIRNFLSNLPKEHPSRKWYEKFNKTDSEIADTWLNPYAVHYNRKLLGSLLLDEGFRAYRISREGPKLMFMGIK